MKNKPSLTIVKIGGNIIDNEIDLKQSLYDFTAIQGSKILVHGGGKSATKMAESLGLTPQMVDGRRITDKKMLAITVMMYAGLINKRIVAELQALDNLSIGFSGADGNLILSEKKKHPSIDFGFVGDIVQVNTPLLEQLISQDIVPIFCAITHDKKGQLLNTNADTIASELAIALSIFFDVNLIYCFEKQGVLMDFEDDTTVIETISVATYQELKEKKIIHSGMLPKIDNCFNALIKGVQKISIGHHSLLQNKDAIYTTIRL